MLADLFEAVVRYGARKGVSVSRGENEQFWLHTPQQGTGLVRVAEDRSAIQIVYSKGLLKTSTLREFTIKDFDDVISSRNSLAFPHVQEAARWLVKGLLGEYDLGGSPVKCLSPTMAPGLQADSSYLTFERP